MLLPSDGHQQRSFEMGKEGSKGHKDLRVRSCIYNLLGHVVK